MTLELKVSFGVLERALSTTLRINPDRADAFRARLKQLQRLSFPTGVNVGRGAKMNYSTEHLVQLALAFEMMSLGLPAKTAAELVIAGWERTRSACHVIAQRRPILIGDHPKPIMMLVRPDYLSDADKAPLPTFEDEDSLNNVLGNPQVHPGSYIVVELEKLIHKLLTVGGESARLGAEIAYREIGSWPAPGEYDWSDSERNWFRVGSFNEFARPS